MRAGNHSIQASNWASSTELKELKLHLVYSGILEHAKPAQLLVEAELKFDSKF